MNRELDEYAQSMFRFEHLNAEWIERCARYLGRIFGDRLSGRTVLDYAFGRGNWSMAFLAAGAAKVIAVDAAPSNVHRFADYCRQHHVRGVEVVQGNILESPLSCSADILWIYGILPCVSEPETFLKATSRLARDANAESILYAYNAGSLRQVIVELARRGRTYTGYKEFLADAMLLSPAARLRARDDLTAPLANLHSAGQLWEQAARSGHTPLEFVPSFEQAEGRETPEFRAHHLRCRAAGGESPQPGRGVEASPDVAVDLEILRDLGHGLMDACSVESRRKIALGLFNTHFAALQTGYERCLVDDWLYILHGCLVHGVSPKTDLQALIFEISDKALKGMKRGPPPPQASQSVIIRFLLENRIRL
jgi:hypothetical protein